MRFSKLVSGISSLAIAASAFAGLAVTGHAAEVLPKIDENYAEMSAEDLASAVSQYTLTSSEPNQSSVKAVTGSGIQLYANVRKEYGDIYAARTLSTTYDDKDIVISGAWDTGNSTIGSGSRVYLAFLDSSGNDIFRLSANRNDYGYWYSIGGGSEVKLGTLNSSQNSVTINFSVVFDAENNAITSAVFNGTTMISESTDITASDLATVRMGRVYGGTDPSGRMASNATLNSLTIKEVPEATSAGAIGADEINIGTSEVYDPAVLDQYGDEIEYDGDVSLTLKEDVTGVTFENNTLTVDDTATAGDTITLVATAGDYTGEKTVTISNTNGYIVKTTPYSQVYVDDTLVATVQSSGEVEMAKSYADGNTHALKITKSGYTDSETTLELALNETGTYTLTPSDSSVSYYEDFSNVTDNLQSTNTSAIHVSDGVLIFTPTSSTSTTCSLATSVALDGKVLDLSAAMYSSSGNHQLHVYLTGPNLHMYIYGGYLKIYGKKGSEFSFTRASNNADTYNDIKLYFNGTTVSLYENGALKGSVTIDGTTTLTGFSTYAAKNSTFSLKIDKMSVIALPDEYTVTYSDGNSTTTQKYLTGSTATLPTAAGKDGYTFSGWYDGTNTYTEGATVTVSADVTYTAVYTKNATTINATNVGAFTGTSDDTATAFTAALENSGTVTITGITVTPSEGEAETFTVDSDGSELPTLTDVNAVIGIIVNGIADAGATATVTFE